MTGNDQISDIESDWTIVCNWSGTEIQDLNLALFLKVRYRFTRTRQ